MTKEEFVTLEVAKILKEKCFVEKTDAYYKSGVFGWCLFRDGIAYNSLSYKNYYSAPSLAQAARWLREEHNLNIRVDYDESQLWGWSIQRCNDRDDYEDNCSMFDTYEEALNEGIKNALKLINYDKGRI